jgi:hypothetical protein
MDLPDALSQRLPVSPAGSWSVLRSMMCATLHLATSRTTLVHDLDDVVAEACTHRLAHFTHRLRACTLRFEGIHHLQGTEPSEIAAVLGRARIIGTALLLWRALAKSSPFITRSRKAVDALPSDKGVLR